MMSQRQAAFRADFRRRVSPWYSGLAHVAMIYGIGFAGIWYFAQQIGSPAWYEWLIVPVAFTLANIFEWWLHRYVMHRPIKGFMGIYKRHTLAHHQFFTEEEPAIDSTRDFRITFFPPYALITFMAMSVVPAWILNRAGLPDAGWLLLITNTALYLNYELFHWCCHVKDDRIVRRIPIVNSLRRHHVAHHNPAIMMERNFNLTYPIADALFRTSDLDRSVLGHVFNGYSTKHVRRDLKKVRASARDRRPADAAAAAMAGR
ncbi:hypothetical protein [Stella sp.]|uniref:hypothetical protein n=1 Tax=Stella sp. TaxID=2912054 RepID=UPI0035B32ED4